MSCPYNSRDLHHKSVFGALAKDENVKFSILLPRSFSCSGASFVVRKDFANAQKIDLAWSNITQNGEEEWWTTDYSFPSPGLYFYHFEYQTPFGTGKIYLKNSGLGEYSPLGTEWQQTVYEPDLSTPPDWIKNAIMYQIFPDRFFSSGKKKENVPEDRVMHKDPCEPLLWNIGEEKIQNNDYFGGDLDGIIEKLPYLSSLSVSVIYLNPIFEAHSNHRYNTADFMKVDPLLGNEKSLKRLCKKASEYGIRIILDGVFSHIGSDSVYFNREKRYGEGGAYNDSNSPYRSWFTFTSDGKYNCWWNIKSLPEINETEPSFLEFILGENGVVQKWLDCGISGWRLDVADELPDLFLDKLYQSVKRKAPDSLIIGEVWEDASNKISYGSRRRYLLGNQLDSVMNYPFAEAMVRFMRNGIAEELMESLVSICENYPRQILNSLMNHIGTHDTARIITRLTNSEIEKKPRSLQSKYKITPEEYQAGKAYLKAITVMQYMLPGFPSIYYADEAGLSGGCDPFNRACYPWGREDGELIEHYRLLGRLRSLLPCLKDGDFVPVSAMLGCIAFARESKESNCAIIVIINRNSHEIDYYLPERYKFSKELLTGSPCGEFVRVKKIGAAVVKARYLNN